MRPGLLPLFLTGTGSRGGVGAEGVGEGVGEEESNYKPQGSVPQ